MGVFKELAFSDTMATNIGKGIQNAHSFKQIQTVADE
jgi:hypothetical protein